PPAVSRGTPSAVEVREGHNVTLTCKAEGNPTPTVVWRRQDKQIIRYNGATGFGVPPLMQAKTPTVRIPLGGLARLVCTAESWPRPDVTWDKDGQQIFDSDNYATSQTVSGQYHSVHVLEIRRVEKHHYGSYRCTARNDNGVHFADIDLEGMNYSHSFSSLFFLLIFYFHKKNLGNFRSRAELPIHERDSRR
ncbi:immunoglobulin domain protein, partial [Necator americanus]